MMRKKLESESAESESGAEIAHFGFLIFYEKPADSGSRIRIAIPEYNTILLWFSYYGKRVYKQSSSIIIFNDFRILYKNESFGM